MQVGYDTASGTIPLAQAPFRPSPVETNGTTPPKGLRRIAAALHHRDFRVLWFGACFSSIGTWMQSLAENWLVLSLTASAFYLGLDAFLQQLPIMLFTLIGGVVADRHDRRLTLMASQWVQLSTAAIARGARVCRGRSRSGTSCCSPLLPAPRRRSAGRRINR